MGLIITVMTVTRIKDIISKPSQALEAMIDGLIKQSKRPGFIINMNTFGASEGGICYGCAATCCIQEIASKDLDCGDALADINSRDGRAKQLHLSPIDLAKFENAIDSARKGNKYGVTFESLFAFFGMYPEYASNFTAIGNIRASLPELETRNWEKHISQWRKGIEELKELGF